LTIVIAAAAGLRVWGIGFGLPHDLARPDEEKLIGAALGVAHGDLNPHFFLYPTLFIYVMAAAFKLLFLVRPSAGMPTLHLATRLLSAAAGVATIPALYLAVSELFSKRIALISAVLLAVTFLHVRDSHFGTTDVPVTLLIVLAVWAAIRCARRGLSAPRVAAAGILSGLAASTKYNAALVAVPCGIVILEDFRSGRSVTRSIGMLALLSACVVAAFLAGTPYALLDRAAFATEFRQQSMTAIGQRGGNVLQPAREIVGERGWKHHFIFSLRYGVGELMLAAAVAGAVIVCVPPTLRGILILSFPLLFYAAMGISELVYPRWVVPLVPFVCLFAAVSIDRVAHLGTHTLGRRLAAAVAVLLTVLVAAPSAARAVAFDRVIAETDTRVLAAEWIQDHFPRGATLYQTGVWYGFVQPQPADEYPILGFDEVRNVFTADGHRTDRTPDILVILHSPLLIFSGVPDAIPAIASARYELSQTFQATRRDRPFDGVYDQQDAFYVPFAGFDSVRRPGPDVEIYVRR